jgi:hypothetical protein
MMMPPILEIYPELGSVLLGWYLLGIATGMAVTYLLLER